MMIISTSLTVSTQPSPRFHVEAWLPFTKNGYCQFNRIKFVKEQRNLSKIIILPQVHAQKSCALQNSGMTWDRG